MAELEFDHPDHASRAEKSWKEIAGVLQSILGYNVELRINMSRDGSSRKGKAKKPCLSLLNCSRKVLFKMKKSSSNGSTPMTVRTRDRCVETCSSECNSQVSCSCYRRKEMVKTIRSSEGNALSIEAGAPNASLPDQSGCKPRYALSCTRILLFCTHLVFHYHMRARAHIVFLVLYLMFHYHLRARALDFFVCISCFTIICVHVHAFLFIYL